MCVRKKESVHDCKDIYMYFGGATQYVATHVTREYHCNQGIDHVD